MKFLAVFSALVAVALASPAVWTISDLSAALQSSNTNPALIPYLEHALDQAMFAAMQGHPSPVVTVSTPVQDISYWTLNELSEAIQDPNVNPALLPILEEALDALMYHLMTGGSQEPVIVATPIGLLPVDSQVPVLPVDAPVVPIPAPVVPNPAPVVAPEVPAASSPLVQIIVNINQQQESGVAEIPAEVVAPIVTPGNPLPPPVDTIAVNPIGVRPPVNPIDVIAISPPEINPIDVIAVSAPEINPIDVIAVSAPEINPIDLIHPVPVVQPVVGVVGPLV